MLARLEEDGDQKYCYQTENLNNQNSTSMISQELPRPSNFEKKLGFKPKSSRTICLAEFRIRRYKLTAGTLSGLSWLQF